MRNLSLIAFAVLLGGCAVKPISESGPFIVYGHGSRDSAFKKVYEDATKKCEGRGLVAKQTSTVCPDRCVTNFECVQR